MKRPFCSAIYVIALFSIILLISGCINISVSEPSDKAVRGALSVTDWSGTWDTNWGMMYLTQTSGKVSGTYEHDKGKITGFISKNSPGNILTGTWSEAPDYSPPDNAGDIEWTMSDGFSSFTGKWRYGSSGDWSGEWTGKKVNSKVINITP